MKNASQNNDYPDKLTQLKLIINLFPENSFKVDIYGVILEFSELLEFSITRFFAENQNVLAGMDLPRESKKLTHLIETLTGSDHELNELLQLSNSLNWPHIKESIMEIKKNKAVTFKRDLKTPPKRHNLDDIIGKKGVYLISNNLSEAYEFDFVFIHGMIGDAVLSWCHDDNTKNFWPKWIGDDYKNSKVWTIGYDTALFKLSKCTAHIEDIGYSLLDTLNSKRIGKKPIVFITHSMGGLVLKHLLVKAFKIERYSEIAQNTKGIFFIATPHHGIQDVSVFSSYFGIPGASAQTSEMDAFNRKLNDLNRDFREYFDSHGDIKCMAYCEQEKMTAGQLIKPKNKVSFILQKVGGVVQKQLVHETSADPGLSGVETIPINNTNHLSIVKPIDKEHQIYESITTFIDDEYE